MRQCIAEEGRWPDASADVSPDEMEEFQAHADLCPYHEEILLREFESNLRSVFRLARGLDEEGRVLHGAELQMAIEEQERRRTEWETVGITESPISLISLYNGSRLIAGHGELRNYSYQISLHDLDPRAGLRLMANCGSNSDEKVLLAFYALEGVDHDGDEFFRPLGNGCTIGLKVMQKADRSFEICFRCVEDEVLQRERNVQEAGAGGPFIRYASQRADAPAGIISGEFPWFVPQTNVGWATAVCVLLLILYPLASVGPLFNIRRLGAAATAAPTQSGAEGEMSQNRPPVSPSADNGTSDGTQERGREISLVTKHPRHSRDLIAARFRRNLKRALARRHKPDHMEVVVQRTWTIIFSGHQIGSDLEIRHSGNDPELADRLKNAFDKWNQLNAQSEVARSVQVTYGEEAKSIRADIEVFWTVSRPVEAPVTIAAELRVQSDDGLAPNCTLQFPTPARGVGLDDTTVLRALRGVNMHVSGLAAIKNEWSTATASHPTIEPLTPEADESTYVGQSWHDGGVDASRPITLEEDVEAR